MACREYGECIKGFPLANTTRENLDSFIYQKLDTRLSTSWYVQKEMVNTNNAVVEDKTPEGLIIALIFNNAHA